MENKYIMWEGEKWYYEIKADILSFNCNTYFSKSPMELKYFLGIFSYYTYEFYVPFCIENSNYSKEELEKKLRPYFKIIKRREEIKNNDII